MRKVWTYAPHSGGVKIKPAEQGRIRQRILAHANKHYAGKFTRLDIRFHGALVYIDAYVEPNPPSKKLLQVRGETKEQVPRVHEEFADASLPLTALYGG